MIEVGAIPNISAFVDFISCDLLTRCVQVKAFESFSGQKRLSGLMHKYRSIAQLVTISARGRIISLRTLKLCIVHENTQSML